MKRAIEASAAVNATLAQVREALKDDAAGVLADHGSGSQGSAAGSAAQASVEPFLEVLTVDLGGGTHADQEVVIELGASEHGLDESLWPLSWEPRGHEFVVPSFKGSFVVRSVEGTSVVLLTGEYQPPLGIVGGVVDRVLGPRLAGATVAALIERLAHRVECEVGRRAAQPPASIADASNTPELGDDPEMPSDYWLG